MNIEEYRLDEKKCNKRCSFTMLPEAIKGLEVSYHHMECGDKESFSRSRSAIRIFFLIDGDITIIDDKKEYKYKEKSCFVPSLDNDVEIKSNVPSSFLLLQFTLTEDDRKLLDKKSDIFPYSCIYKDAIQYRDPFKSEKTISRMIIPHRIIPRFAFGSVETYGTDLIGQHEHPLLDQFFFSFKGNDMELLIGDDSYHMGELTLIHIPLGSNHGVRVDEKGVAHYLWIDVVLTPEGDDYLDEVHKKTGTQRSF